MSGRTLSRRKALITIGKAAAGIAAVTLATAAGIDGYFYYEGRSSASRKTQTTSVSAVSSASSSATAVEPGYTSLFDGVTMDGWEQAGPGGFNVVDGMLQSFGGLGLLWYTKRQFTDFILKVDWKVVHFRDNSGVFLRFPNPGDNPWVAVDNGYEVQIDDFGAPDGDPIDKTGGIYSFAAPSKVASNTPGDWNYYELHAVGQSYRVILNGDEVTDFTGQRGTVGYIGLQNHDDTSTVTFRNIRIMEL
jgi:Domain of Unknown Function (DUF1080)